VQSRNLFVDRDVAADFSLGLTPDPDMLRPWPDAINDRADHYTAVRFEFGNYERFGQTNSPLPLILSSDLAHRSVPLVSSVPAPSVLGRIAAAYLRKRLAIGEERYEVRLTAWAAANQPTTLAFRKLHITVNF